MEQKQMSMVEYALELNSIHAALTANIRAWESTIKAQAERIQELEKQLAELPKAKK